MALIERDAELAAIGSALEHAVAGRGRAVLVEGPGGIGKSTLLAATAARAREDGIRVLAARGGALEGSTPWGVAGQLFEVPPGDLFAALHGLYWAVVRAAEVGPLVIAVDDAHLADAPSQQFLGFLARRLDALAVLLLIAARPRPAGEVRPLDAVARVPWAEVIEPAPLGEAGVATLLGATEPELVSACRDVTGGNPQLLRELRRALRPGATATDVRRIAPRGVARAVLVELAALPPSATSLVRAVAVLESAPDVALVAELAEMGLADAESGVDRATAAGILTREPVAPPPGSAVAPPVPPSPGSVAAPPVPAPPGSAVAPTGPAPPGSATAAGVAVRFVHPIVREAVYADLPAGARDALHRRAAVLLHRRGAPATAAAAHLLASAPAADPDAVALLRAAGVEALIGGSPQGAVAYLRRALAEPPPVAAPVLAELGTAEAALQDPAAIAHLEAALAGGEEVATTLAAALGAAGRPLDAVAVLDAALERSTDPVVAARLEADLVAAARRDVRTHALAAERVPRLRERLADVAGLPEERVVRAHLAFVAAAQLPAPEVAALALAALAGGQLLAEQGPESGAFVMAIIALWAADALPEARAAVDGALELARRRSSPLGFVLNSAWRSHIAWRAGDLSTAEADAQAVLDVARELGLPPGILYGVAGLADVLVERGELEEADRLFAGAGLDGALHGTDADQPVLFARGRLRAAQGRPLEALADQLACGEGLAAFGMRLPIVPWGSEAALAAAAAGRREEAEALLDVELSQARLSAAPRSIGVALRAAGTIRGDRALLEEAVAVLEPSPARLELAYALAALGELLARTGEGLDHLRRALDLADRCGATAVANRAREALRAAGARPRRARVTGPAALTASERRVAHLAAAGHSNREIAQALFVTPRTVELHLTSSYRKLGVKARSELAAALADDA